MGGSILCTCPDCGHQEIRYQSCGNRNCPKCGGHKVTQWVQKRLAERLPVDYFMATFTLPHEFNFLFRQHPAEAVKIFMKCVSDSLLEIGKSKLHGMVGFMMVYQSWCRNGDFHPHIHALLPCGALSADSNIWHFPKRRDFLFPEAPLMRLFRGKFNAAGSLPERKRSGGMFFARNTSSISSVLATAKTRSNIWPPTRSAALSATTGLSNTMAKR